MPGFLYNSVKGADEMRKKSFRSGFTMVETLIVIVVIAILAALGMLGVDEFVASAKATKIINNLYTLKAATWAWYADNKQNVTQYKGTFRGKSVVAGMVAIGNIVKPIQEWGDKDLKLSQYIERIEKGTGINLNKTYTTKNSDGKEQTNTDLAKGYYGICDGGGKAGKRHVWYAGYRFNDNEEKVREKIRGRLKTSNLMFGTADAHPDPDDEKAAAVWLRVR